MGKITIAIISISFMVIMFNIFHLLKLHIYIYDFFTFLNCCCPNVPLVNIIFPIISNSFHLFFINFKELLKQNQIFQVVIFSGFSYYAGILAHLFARSFIYPLFLSVKSSITVHNTDESFNIILDYISEHLLTDITGGKSSMQANTKKIKKNRKYWIQEYLGTLTNNKPILEYRPDNDQAIHILKYKGKRIYFERLKSSQPLMGSDSRVPFTPESFTLSVWGWPSWSSVSNSHSNNNGMNNNNSSSRSDSSRNENSNMQLLRDLLNEAIESYYNSSEKEKVIHIYTQCSANWLVGWELALTKIPRPRESVILDLDILDSLLEDARTFLNSGTWYSSMGIPYRRGYLLYGPPGCGKTSFAQVLAGELGLNICMLNLTHQGVNDNSLAEYLRDAPHKSVIVFEDVDAVFVDRNLTTHSHTRNSNNSSSNNSNVSFSGLLNAIDGVASQEGRIFFMTTNHIEKLDPALIRPGRCDVKMELKCASRLQMEKLFARFYPSVSPTLAQQFASRLPEHEISMATLQGFFLKEVMSNHRSAEECIAKSMTLVQSLKSSNNTSSSDVISLSIYDGLFRLGLERYASLLRHHGINTFEDLIHYELSYVTTLSVELQYDLIAVKAIDLLMKAVKEKCNNTINNTAKLSYASSLILEKCFIVETVYIKESFLETYRNYFHNSNYDSSSNMLTIANVLEVHGNDNNDAETFMSSNKCLNSKESADINIDEHEYEENCLNKLANTFCDKLSRNGKSYVSLCNLQLLLSCFPNQPKECIQHTQYFIQPSLPQHTQISQNSSACEVIVNNSLSYHDIDLYTFLKRIGLTSIMYTSFHNNKITTLFDLIRLSQERPSTKELAEALHSFGVPHPKSHELAELLKKDNSSARGTLMNFALHEKSRVIATFVQFYSQQNNYKTKNGNNSSSNSNECASTISISSSSQLEMLAYKFASIVCDKRGRSQVSLFEINHYLHTHSTDPVTAADTATVTRELLYPDYPQPPQSVTETNTHSKEWIYIWLQNKLTTSTTASNSNDDLSKYSIHFINEGIRTKGDLIAYATLLCAADSTNNIRSSSGSQISRMQHMTLMHVDQTLKDILKVDKLGHRWKIINMLDALITDKDEKNMQQ